MINSNLENCRHINISNFKDNRGSLSYIELNSKSLPFVPRRIFYITDAPMNVVRGDHAHKACEQILIVISGRIQINLDDGRISSTLTLKNNNKGLYIPAGIWSTQKFILQNSLMVVLASHNYDAEDYIDNFNEFRKLKND